MANYEVRRSHIEPLWDRVDRNRVRLTFFLILFFVATTLSLAVLVTAAMLIVTLVVMGGLLEFGVWITGSSGLYVWLGTISLCAIGVLVYMLWSLTRDERWFARRLEATLVPKGEMLPTKYALKDMAIASGFDVAPALFVLETRNVNAFVYQRGHRRAIVGVTRGLTERLDPDEQRAVFANLMARLQQGDMLWASAVTALMSPLWHIRERQLTADEQVVLDSKGELRAVDRQIGASDAEVASAAIMTVFVVISELLAYGHRSSQLKHAETADAEGMLLLKDPRSMLSALEKCVRFNNFVPTAGPEMTQLFYCWTGGSSTDDEEDPENRRVVRLREVLGVEGQAPVVVTPNEPTMLIAPPAPRLEESGSIDPAG